MSVLISDDILQAAHITEAELKHEIAILLFQQKKLGLSKARELAGIPLIEFQRELANRGLSVQDEMILRQDGFVHCKTLQRNNVTNIICYKNS
ncbi:UPF0175 family protein [Myxacorys almedinensis]|uniref:UPF0175 family protein n=1 Tax=Myxacorys almedinensis A TaxID=2690445 RepID=A0A8J8CLF0_9CYAN|nr:UPF0175 family protein [Myxacorys almedinensis A]